MRVQVKLSDEMVEKVDFYARKMGVSRSALCSILVGQGIMSYDSSIDLLNKLCDNLGDEFIATKIKEAALSSEDE